MKMTVKYLSLCVMVLVLAFSVSCTRSKQSTTAELRLGFIPDESKETLLKKLQFLKEYLEKEMEMKISYVIPTTYDELIALFVKGDVDVGYFGGLTYVRAAKATPTVPLFMRKADEKFHSYFIVKSDSDINSLEDLRGKTFTFGSESSTSGHLMPRYYLKENKINPDYDFKGKPKYSGAHDKTVQWVMEGKVEAGVLSALVFDRMVKEGKISQKEIKIIWTTPPYVDYVWAARADIDPEISKKLKDAFLGLLPGDPEQRKILDTLSAQYYVSAQDKQFSIIRKVASELKLLK